MKYRHDETYGISVECSNCGYGHAEFFDRVTEIPKGVTIADYLRHKECPRCGCHTLRKA